VFKSSLKLLNDIIFWLRAVTPKIKIGQWYCWSQ